VVTDVRGDCSGVPDALPVDVGSQLEAQLGFQQEHLQMASSIP
jgi:hypothetical protein